MRIKRTYQGIKKNTANQRNKDKNFGHPVFTVAT